MVSIATKSLILHDNEEELFKFRKRVLWYINRCKNSQIQI